MKDVGMLHKRATLSKISVLVPRDVNFIIVINYTSGETHQERTLLQVVSTRTFGGTLELSIPVVDGRGESTTFIAMWAVGEGLLGFELSK